MTMITLADLQASVRDKSAFGELAQYFTLCHTFLTLIEETQPTRIISPTDHNYVFYQYDEAYGHRITRPLNESLFLESAEDFKAAFERFMTFLADLKRTVFGSSCYEAATAAGIRGVTWFSAE